MSISRPYSRPLQPVGNGPIVAKAVMLLFGHSVLTVNEIEGKIIRQEERGGEDICHFM